MSDSKKTIRMSLKNKWNKDIKRFTKEYKLETFFERK